MIIIMVENVSVFINLPIWSKLITEHFLFLQVYLLKF